MLLAELSLSYRHSAELLRQRIKRLREEQKNQPDREARRQLERRMAELEPLLREMRELAVLTARYYDRGYHKNEKYTL